MLAADGGLDGGDSGDGGGDTEPQLPTDGPTCLQKVLIVPCASKLHCFRNI